MSKANGVDGTGWELSLWKDDSAVKVLYPMSSLEASAVAPGVEMSVFIPTPKKAMSKNIRLSHNTI